MTVDERPPAPGAVGPPHPEREDGEQGAVGREAYGDARSDETRRPDTGADLGRRRFFRALGGETVRSAAAIAGAAVAIRRQAAETTGDLLGGMWTDAGTASRRSEGGGPGARPPRFRSPYRVTDDALHLVDQRALPETISEVACRTSGDVIAAIRSKAVYGAPVVAQVAAYGVWLTASRATGRDPKAVEALLEGAANSLKEVVSRFRAAIAAVDRMEERRRSVPADGADVVEALRREADAIAMEAMFDHARLGRAGAALLRQPPE